MKTMKTSELTGAALDWAVAKCEGVRLSGASLSFQVETLGTVSRGSAPYAPSQDWGIAGPIIEREGVEINVRNWSPSQGCRLPGKYEWSGRLCYVRQTECKQFGPTPLIAAMRCYVASKLGNVVEVPVELLGDEH